MSTSYVLWNWISCLPLLKLTLSEISLEGCPFVSKNDDFISRTGFLEIEFQLNTINPIYKLEINFMTSAKLFLKVIDEFSGAS